MPRDSAQPQAQRSNPRAWPAAELEWLPGCPICHDPAATVLYRDLVDRIYSAPGIWQLMRCRNCGCGYLNPRPTPKSIGLAYQGYYTHAGPTANPAAAAPEKPLRRFKRGLRNGYLNHRYGCRLSPSCTAGRWLVSALPSLARRAQRLMRYLPPPSSSTKPRLLDVGCGDGEFLRRMLALGWEVCGLDPDETAARAAEETGIPIHPGSLSSHPYPDGSFDAITLYHVIEHLHDPLEALRACWRLLRHKGTLAIFTPNLASLAHRAFLQDWYPLQPPTHLILFTRRPLRTLVRQAGFERASFRASFSSSAIINASTRLAEQAPASKRRPAYRRLLPFAAPLSFAVPSLAEEVILVASKS
jgi:SAM-dependent methyltransferase